MQHAEIERNNRKIPQLDDSSVDFQQNIQIWKDVKKWMNAQKGLYFSSCFYQQGHVYYAEMFISHVERWGYVQMQVQNGLQKSN